MIFEEKQAMQQNARIQLRNLVQTNQSLASSINIQLQLTIDHFENLEIRVKCII